VKLGLWLLGLVAWIPNDGFVVEVAKDSVRVLVLLGSLQMVGVALEYAHLSHTHDFFVLAHEILAFGNFVFLGAKSTGGLLWRALR